MILIAGTLGGLVAQWTPTPLQSLQGQSVRRPVLPGGTKAWSQPVSQTGSGPPQLPLPLVRGFTYYVSHRWGGLISYLF